MDQVESIQSLEEGDCRCDLCREARRAVTAAAAESGQAAFHAIPEAIRQVERLIPRL